MSGTRASFLYLALPVALALGACGGSGSGGNSGSGGAGGAGDAAADGATAPGAGGAGGGAAAGGTSGGSAGAAGSSAGGTSGGGGAGAGGAMNPAGGNGGAAGGAAGADAASPPIDRIDAGLPNIDAGLPGLIDAGVLTTCPAQPMGKTCGGPSAPVACVIEGTQPLQGCVCLLQSWVCPGGGGPTPTVDAGSVTQTPRACEAGAAGKACSPEGTVCAIGTMGGCLCLPGAGGAATWRCSP